MLGLSNHLFIYPPCVYYVAGIALGAGPVKITHCVSVLRELIFYWSGEKKTDKQVDVTSCLLISVTKVNKAENGGLPCLIPIHTLRSCSGPISFVGPPLFSPFGLCLVSSLVTHSSFCFVLLWHLCHSTLNWSSLWMRVFSTIDCEPIITNAMRQVLFLNRN